jgi:hypothetical protein
LRVVEQSLRNADALAHAAGKSTEGTIASVGQIDHGKKFVDAATRRGRFETFDGGEVFQKFESGEMRINAKVLRQVTQNHAQRIRRRQDICVVPKYTAARGPSDSGEDTHQRGLSCAIGTEKTQNARTQLQVDVLQPPNISTILFSNRVDEEMHTCEALRGKKRRTCLSETTN